jgi:nitric oxide reductase large subunit
MSIDLSALHLSPLLWLVGLIVIVVVAFGIFQYFFRHLIHLFIRGCGLIIIIAVLLYVLHLLKLL